VALNTNIKLMINFPGPLRGPQHAPKEDASRFKGEKKGVGGEGEGLRQSDVIQHGSRAATGTAAV
jgi:hypothetical protein